MLLGNFYKKPKRPQDAIAAYRDALARDDEHQNALFSLALAYKDEGRLDEARVGFERARELDPRNGKVLWQLADLWMRKGDSARAEAVHHRRARAKSRRAPAAAEARREPDRGEALRRGRARAQGGARKEARAGARALRPRPRLRRAGADRQGDRRPTKRSSRPTRRPIRAAFNAAKLLQKSGRSQEAVAHFRKAVEIEPTFGTGQLYLAKALLDAGDLGGAEAMGAAGSDEQARAADGAARPLRARRRLRTPGPRRRCAARGRGRKAESRRGPETQSADRPLDPIAKGGRRDGGVEFARGGGSRWSGFTTGSGFSS